MMTVHSRCRQDELGAVQYLWRLGTEGLLILWEGEEVKLVVTMEHTFNPALQRQRQTNLWA